MKYPIHKLLLLAGSIALALPFSSCRQHIDEVDGMAKKGFYNAPRQVYFQRATSEVPVSDYPYGSAVLRPSGVLISSGVLTADSTVVRVDVPIRLAGPTSSSRLEVKVKVGTPIDYSSSIANEKDRPQPAIAGTDYEALASSYYIPADSIRATIPVVFKRSGVAQAGEAGKELILQLEPSADLETRFTASLTYRIRIVDDLQQPVWWIGFSNETGGMGILGDYSRVKFQYLLAKFPKVASFKGSRAMEAYTPANIAYIAGAALEIAKEHPELGLNEAQIRRFLP